MRQFRENDLSFTPDYRREAGRRTRRVAVLTKDGWGDGGALDELDPSINGGAQLPAIAVTEGEAQVFCVWLTMRERQEGRLPPGLYYRLPTHTEWLEAAAAGESLPELVPRASGNFAGPEAENESWPTDRAVSAGRDPYPHSAPVASFPPNALGLFDLFGNVAEWVTRDTPDPDSAELRFGRIGGSWAELPESALKPDRSRARRGQLVRGDMGVRIVLDLAPPEQ